MRYVLGQDGYLFTTSRETRLGQPPQERSSSGSVHRTSRTVRGSARPRRGVPTVRGVHDRSSEFFVDRLASWNAATALDRPAIPERADNLRRARRGLQPLLA